MPRFKINITEDVYRFVEADNVDEARKKVKAEIATGAVSPFYDKLNFDYETGVNYKDESLGGLRQKLGRAETPEEQEQVLTKFVGSSGFTRNTKGQIALNPTGLEELGLPIQYKTLADGSKIPLNTIIDENSFNLRTGDLADFAGIAGPIIGAITLMSPQLRVLKGITSLFGGRERIARTFAAGVGSAAGKAGEEALDTKEGFQLQDRDELRDLFGGEFLFGSVGQGIGEMFGLGYNLVLGKKAATDDLRIIRQQAKGRSAVDIFKLDADLGKEATERQIARAVRDGKVKEFNFKGIASQATLGKTLPGRLQSIGEEVIGNSRDKETAKYLALDLDNLLREIGGENALAQKSISDATKGSLDEQVQAYVQELRLKENNVTQSLKDLLEQITDDAIEVGNYGDAPSRRALGDAIKKNLSKARREVVVDLGKKYRNVDKLFAQLTSTQGKSGVELLRAQTLDRVIRNTMQTNLDDSLKLIKQHKDADYFWGVNNKDELDGGIVAKIERALADFQRDIKDPSKSISLSHVRNAYSKLNAISRDTLEASPERKVIIEIMRKLDDSRTNMNGEVFRSGQPDSILTQLEINGLSDFNIQLAKNIKKAGLGDEVFDIETNALKDVNFAITELRNANKLAAERMAPFDRLEIKKIISNAQRGAHDADDVYKKVILNGEYKELDDIFKGLRQYDDYMKQAGKPGTAEATLKGQIKKRLFADAFRDSTDIATDSIDFTTFAKKVKKFERDEPGKFDLLFTDSATGRNTGKLVRETIDQINKISPRLKPQDIKNLVNDFTTGNKGLNSSDQGMAFIQGLKKLATESEKRLKFEANRAISDLPLKGVDETVNIIFRPNANANIEILRETVSPEVFKSIQQASMQKLLAKSIDLNGKGKITDLFKVGNLKTALDSYGDETLNAMFGKELTQGLRNFHRSIDSLTRKESGRGGAAGGLVAAGIGASLAFNPLAVLPTIAALAIARQIFSSPALVAIFAKTDKGSIAKLIDAVDKATRQYFVRELGGTSGELGGAASELGSDALNSLGLDKLIEPGKKMLDQGMNAFEDMQNQATNALKTSQIEMPTVTPVQTGGLGSIDPSRVEFAEQIAGRPVFRA